MRGWGGWVGGRYGVLAVFGLEHLAETAGDGRRIERLEDGGGGFVVVLLATFGVGCSSSGRDEVFEFFLLRVVLGGKAVVGGFPFFEVVQ